MKKIDKNMRYEGMGFAETLIALMIAGIVGVVLMQISSSTLRELAQLDIQDAIAKHAVSASVDLQRIAIQDMTQPEGSKEFEKLIESWCFNISQDGASIPVIPIDCPSVRNPNRDAYSKVYIDTNNDGTVDQETDYFRIFRVKELDSKRAILEIITGVTDLPGQNTTKNDIKDYTYLVIIAR